MRINVDYDKCIGIGMCEAVAAALFAVQDDGTLEVLTDDVPESQRDALEEAVSVCPTAAITFVE